MAATASHIKAAPQGWDKLRWLGPGFLWMVSAAGSGELLFTPRVGSLYGYTLIWAMIAAVIFKWFINREIGRYTVCTGETVIDGFGKISKWFVYIILIPQLFVAVATIAGLAGSSATALVLIFPGDIRLWTIGSILVSTALVTWGKFKTIELVATIIAVLLSLSAIVAAILVFPDGAALLEGFVPKTPPDVDYEEILPWLGFMLSGAAGMIWYSYWIQKKGYGAAGNKTTINMSKLSVDDKKSLEGWISQMTLDNNLAVIGTLIITLSFLILGTELLKPQGLVPEEDKVAETLGKILEQLWGPVGFWFMVTGVFIGFWDTVLSDQDGFGRMFSGGTRTLFSKATQKKKWMDEKRLHKFFVIIICTVLPVLLYLLMGEPVTLLKIAGVIEAAHIPVLVVLVLIMNYKTLPKELRPSLFTTILTALSGLFFAVFTIIYLLNLFGVVELN
jgi:Mn2+/Fe2+ NRAMP family transporter